MTVLIDGATEDTSSSSIEATGPIIVSMIGTMKNGMVRITANLGSGEATALTFSCNESVRIARLEFASGVSFKAYLEGTSGDDTDVTVEYIDA